MGIQDDYIADNIVLANVDIIQHWLEDASIYTPDLMTAVIEQIAVLDLIKL